MGDQANIALLISKLPPDSLARRLVLPFCERPADEAVEDARAVLVAVKARNEREMNDDAAEEA